MKKVISYLIAAMMVFTMIPYTAFAADTDTSAADNSISLSLKSWVNPDYRGLLNEEDLNSGGEPFVPYSSETTYLESVEEGGTLLREYMVNRVDSFMLNYKISIDEANSQGDAWLQNIWDGMFEEACKHTGSPVEGDYLRKSYGGFTFGEIGFTYDNKYFYVEIPVTATFYTDYDQEEELTAAVDKLLDEIITDGMTDYQKVKAIYDYMTANIVYDYDNLNDNTYKLKYTAYAALINNTSVCQGYATLFYRLALECGIDARYISGVADNGSSSGRHGWNIVKLGNKYYLVDATWDATYSQAGKNFRYFLKPSFSDHDADEEYETAAFTANYPISEKEYVACTEHTYSSDWSADADSHWHECSCGDIKDKADHDFTWIVDKAATEDATGLKHEECTVCHALRSENTVIDKLAHTHNMVKTDAADATCTEPGNIEFYTCSKCHNIYSDIEGKDQITEKDTVIPATGHTYKTDWSADAYKHWHQCACGDIADEENHKFDGGVITVEPTYTAAGVKTYTCTTCEFTKAEDVPMLQEPEVPEGYIAAGTYEKIKWSIDDEGTLTLEGGTAWVHDEAWDLYKSQIKSVVFKEGITSITGAMFHDSGYKIKSVTFPETLKTICTDAFFGCHLTDIEFPEGLTTIESGAFFSSNLKEVNLPASITNVREDSFNLDDGDIMDVAFAATEDEVKSKNIDIDFDSEYLHIHYGCEDADCEIIAAEPTCIAGGYEMHTCKTCGSTLKLVGEFGEPDYGNHDYIDHGAQEPTCTEVGWNAYKTCSRCEYTTYKEVDATGHSYGEYVTTIKATFGKTGVQTATCADCGATQTRAIAAAEAPTLSVTAYTYNGKAKKPAVTVKNSDGTKLAKSVTYAKGRKNVGTYKVTVKLTGADYTGTEVVTFKINPAKPTNVKLTKGKKQFKVSWKKPAKAYRSQIDGYEIRYATSKSGLEKAKAKKYSGKTLTNKTIKKLKSKKNYYVQVRTYNKIGKTTYVSEWTVAKKIKTK